MSMPPTPSAPAQLVEASPVAATNPPPAPTPSSNPEELAATLENLRTSAALLSRTAEHEDAYYRSLAATSATTKTIRSRSTLKKQ